MTEHRATPEQWDLAASEAADCSHTDACILELRARVEALEAQCEAQRLATLAWGRDVDNHSRWIDDHLKRIMELEAAQQPHQDKLDRLIALDHSLVERVADAIAAKATSAGIVDDRPARAAIREVAAWLRSELNGTNTADRLDEEAAPPPTTRGVRRRWRWTSDRSRQTGV